MKRGIIRSSLVLWFFSSLVLCLSGCAGVSQKDSFSKSEPLLEPQVTLKFSDIPIPTGFKLLNQDSYVFESAGIRVGVLKYQGKADVEQLINFYKNQMQLYNWNLLNLIEYGERLLNFERERESCIIRIMPKGNSMSITIAIGPKSGAQPEKSGKPVK